MSREDLAELGLDFVFESVELIFRASLMLLKLALLNFDELHRVLVNAMIFNYVIRFINPQHEFDIDRFLRY